ncbi:MAG: carboxypeptidase-like regulatory domain-containing protein [Flavipsychrobacter sp.]|nr:carboxypeptidase-like regulatory domain-containing protein [Flavipsychrobacter sp.]
MRRAALFCLFVLFGLAAHAQVIQGEVIDAQTGAPVDGVNIINIHTQKGISTDVDGTFVLFGSYDELIEFRKIGYRVVRIRVPRLVPSHFKIALQQGDIELPEFVLNSHARAKDYKTDSARYGEYYRKVLEFPKMSTIDMMRSPFSAMSKSNRQKWAFQENYIKFQEDKYVDYAFNDKVITALTGFTGDTLQKFKIRYRPSYEFIRGVSEYNFYRYITESAERFKRTFVRPRNAG